MSEKSILLVTLVCDQKITEAVSDFLVGVLEAGVEIGVEDQLLEQTLHCYFQVGDQAAAEENVRRLTEHVRELSEIFGVAEPKIETELVQDQDWGNKWKKYFTPFTITPGLVIKPTWEDYTPLPGEAVIEMDPGMAFGTGHHATTSLCMGFIRSILEKQPGKVLDVGTGTGILAMAAALFGAEQVLGIDNDPDAVMAATENAAHNGLQEKVEVEITPLAEVQGEFQLVVANIIHDVLLEMVIDLARLTAQGGSLVLSGILREKQADNIISAYAAAGFRCVEKKEQGEWAALHLVKD